MTTRASTDSPLGRPTWVKKRDGGEGWTRTNVDGFADRSISPLCHFAHASDSAEYLLSGLRRAHSQMDLPRRRVRAGAPARLARVQTTG